MRPRSGGPRAADPGRACPVAAARDLTAALGCGRSGAAGPRPGARVPGSGSASAAGPWRLEARVRGSAPLGRGRTNRGRELSC